MVGHLQDVDAQVTAAGAVLTRPDLDPGQTHKVIVVSVRFAEYRRSRLCAGFI